ncbi:tetratricopeptide repeat protein [Novipirellula artificiosorum]|uniref:Tetratricopeptide repeat protein n=1 Tax=Novipirellula artificiosorum TaxID=2528016 RepID=A0A5C6E3E5_9BACT|nr:tetratricopeptide repeat protein [Novipirellula artificiosorum]TWU41936.1 Tetratricopeptide repeat protein [Novipirellula artificiosorum]
MPDEKTNNKEPAKPAKSRDNLTWALMAAAATAAAVGFAGLFSLWLRGGPPNDLETIQVAAREYVAGRTVLAGELAKTVEFPSSENAPPADAEPSSDASQAAEEEIADLRKLRDFFVGAGLVARAQQTDEPRKRRELLFEAVPLLEKASKSGFPVGREVEGSRFLGESLFELGRFDEAAIHLEQVVLRAPTLRRALVPLLATAYLKTTEPSAAKALAIMNRYLADESLREEPRRIGERIRIDALTRLGQYDEAENAVAEALEQLPPAESPNPTKHADAREQFLLARAIVAVEKAIGRHGKAPIDELEDRSAVIAELTQTLSDLNDLQRETSPRTSARARIWAARALACQGMPDRALAQLTMVRQQRPFAAEAIVGSLEEVELLAKQGRGTEMLQTTRFMMRELGDKGGFDPALVSFEAFQRRFIVALEKLRDHEAYASAIDITRNMTPVFSPSEALMQEGITYREWAASTIRDGTNVGGDVLRTASEIARSRFRAAGDAFSRAAEIDFDTDRYLSTQWAAIDAYQQGRHFERSIRLLRPYLRYEERRRQPRGLVAFGRALLADNKPNEAIDSLETCIAEFPRDPLRYDARLLLAMAHSEIGDLEKSRSYLMDNLQDGELTPQSPAWRDSLFTLAEMLYRKGYENHLAAQRVGAEERIEKLKENQPILEDAIRRLDEAAERYWPLPRAESATYLAARSHLLAAEWPRLESQSEDVLDAARRTLRTKVDNELQAALDGFSRLKESLLVCEDEERLSDDSRSMLRNCFMSEADTLKELGRLDDASVAYRAVSLRYMNEPTALEAILGQACCVRELGRDREAALLVRQADVVLQRIPPKFDDDFQKTTRYDREGWQQLLAWMNAGIQDPGGIPGQT